MLAVKIARTWWVNPNAARWLDPAEGRRAATAGATAISIPFRGAAGEWKPPLLADHLGPRDRGGEGAWRASGFWKAIRNENIGFLWISTISRGLGRLVSHFCWAIFRVYVTSGRQIPPILLRKQVPAGLFPVSRVDLWEIILEQLEIGSNWYPPKRIPKYGHTMQNLCGPKLSNHFQAMPFNGSWQASFSRVECLLPFHLDLG